MPQAVEINVFKFEELDDYAKERARDWYRDGALDYDWWDAVYDDFEQVCEILGIFLKTSTVRLMGGGSRQERNVYFSGFSSQGDGACFEARYRYRTGAAREIRKYAPQDKVLHRIADQLADTQRRNFYQLNAHTFHRGRYYHEYCMAVEVDRDSQDPTAEAEEALRETLRDLARWLYRQLEKDHDYLLSNEAVDESIEVNAYRFTETGAFYT